MFIFLFVSSYQYRYVLSFHSFRRRFGHIVSEHIVVVYVYPDEFIVLANLSPEYPN